MTKCLKLKTDNLADRMLWKIFKLLISVNVTIFDDVIGNASYNFER